MMNGLDYAYFTAPHWVVGFGHSCNKGAIAMRCPVHGFFYAFRFMVDGVMGSRKAWRFLCPLDQPVTLSAALVWSLWLVVLSPQQRNQS